VRGVRHVAAATLAVTVLVACDADDQDLDPAAEAPDPGTTEAEPEDPTGPDAPAAGDGEEGVAGPDPTLPEVQLLAPDEVDGDPDAGGLDGAVASAAGDLPDGWSVAVVPDPHLGPYVVGVPEGAIVWRVGDDLDPLRDAAAGTAWLRYWEPILVEAGEAGEGSSLRAAVVLDEDDGGRHLTVTATPIQDLPPDDPEAVAERFAETFDVQGLTVEEASTATAGDLEVAALTATTPDDEFDDGVPRRLRQWFYPEGETPVLWSLTCEGPAPDADEVDAACDPLLASFRAPPR
jgi:hypothetical protein